MSFSQFIQWLATPAFLAVGSSVIVQMLKALFPQVQEKLAVVVSVLTAAVVSILAMYFVPYLKTLPPDVEKLWPVVVWAIQQLWYQLFGQKLFMPK